MLRLCAFALCLFLTAFADSTINNHTLPLNDPDRPGCKQVFFWMTKITRTDFTTIEQECSTKDANSRPLPFSALSKFADVFKKSVGSSEFEDSLFFVESDRGSFCAEAKLKAQTTRKLFQLSTTALTTLNGFQCDKRKSVYTNKVVCYRVFCPTITTTSSTTTTIPVTVTPTEQTVGALRIGSLGLPVGSEILMYQIVIGILIFFLLLFLILLLRTCYQLRRANSRHVMSDSRSHVSIRRVTEAVVDPYSSMAGIAETSSLGGPEFYGSIARRKELTRERKAWLRDHACGGSHIGVPSPEDMNGLLPAGSIHRTSMTSLTQPGGPRSLHGPNGSLSRVPGIQAPPGTFPVRPSAYQLSRQNTTDSLHCRPMMTPQPMMLPPSPGANGHANPLSNRDDVEGHMV